MYSVFKKRVLTVPRGGRGGPSAPSICDSEVRGIGPCWIPSEEHFVRHFAEREQNRTEQKGTMSEACWQTGEKSDKLFGTSKLNPTNLAPRAEFEVQSMS